MKKIKDFIENFIASEYQFTRSKYNIEIEDSQCVIESNIVNNFFSKSSSPNHRRTGREFKNEEKKQFAIDNMNSVIPRTLFQIKHYKSPDLGGNLKEIVTTEDIYACYVSYDQKSEMEIGFSRRLYIANTNEGLKIIYLDRYDRTNGTWEGQHALEFLQVISSGELVAIEKYKAPEEETSLAAYNKD